MCGVCVCMYLCVCVWGLLSQCLGLTGCPCRVNKTNLRSGLAQGGLFTSVGRRSGMVGPHTHTHTLGYSRTLSHTDAHDTSLTAKALCSSLGRAPINMTSLLGKRLLTQHANMMPEMKSMGTNKNPGPKGARV